MRKKLTQPSALGAMVTKGFHEAAQEAVARTRAAGVEPAGEAPEMPTKVGKQKPVSRKLQVASS
jgi:hypothetical protein